MPWVYLILAACCEMAWPVGYKYTHGFTKHWPVVGLTVGLLIVSFLLMMLATRDPRMHVGTAYAVWTGLGAAGTAALGIAMFNEPKDLARIACLSLIVIGVVGLKFVGAGGEAKQETQQVTAVK